MPIIESVAITSSKSLAQARQRVIGQYRQWQRAVPGIVEQFQLSMPMSVIRAKIREEFEKNRYVSDLKSIDVLLVKGQMDYQETVNAWKQQSQLMNYFAKEEADPKPTTFLEKFYAGI
ncbi:ndufa6 NADH-ubiquinone oxidoreductase subunit [Tieghemiomyces parasiticus]|uniref:Ndufa6 NADH-ubiquinone oxidoreductase subunit n=1 Tax=Tieghemiomyces parasiticus TaxID=78921 RepID=A0A9W8E1Z5_9FUNG|nr:ndufa6 NADH-ubiquinone oxidoreductase subunit [Tieghemiomyces parasiticus]KAJ1929239.1 ndufa6 NADH-ubiquinone oxidoreductase subunit [Tieghemiomyces parasiticus]